MRRPIYDWIPLAHIKGVHPAIARVERIAGCHPRYVPSNISPAEIIRFLTFHPIAVAELKGRVVCIGSARAFEVCTRILPARTSVPVLLVGRAGDKNLRLHHALELVYLPALSGATSRADLRALYNAYNRLAASGLLDGRLSSKSAFAGLVNVDSRTFRQQHDR